MILEIKDWVFDIDITTTMEYSAKEALEHCTCAYCRNFYAAVDGKYPELRPFLAQFGLNLEAPDELIPYTSTDYQAYYAVAGRILQAGNDFARDVGLDVGVKTAGAAEEVNINTWIREPYFFICTDFLELPWVLDEPEDDVESPANEPSFLKKIWNRLLGKSGSDITYS